MGSLSGRIHEVSSSSCRNGDGEAFDAWLQNPELGGLATAGARSQRFLAVNLYVPATD